MGNEWRRHEVARLIQDNKLVVGDGYRAKNDELGKQGLPFARAGNINDGFQFVDSDRFPIENSNRLGNKVSQSGDVVFTSKGTVGRFAFVQPDTQQFVYSPQLCFWRSLDRDLIDSRFLYYWMLGPEFYAQFKSVAGQTDMAEYVSLTDQRQMHITLPGTEEQLAIVRTLGMLDDKIGLNRKMNETLEAMARALFKSWFVDFDPVRAKAEGRDPGLSADIAALFPDSFEESSLGEIPTGWTAEPTGNLTEVIGGTTPSTKELEYWAPDTHAWATPKDLSSLQTPVLLKTERRVSDKGLTQIGSSLLPVGTVLMSSRAPIGYLAVAEIPVAINQGFIAMKPREGVSNLFLLYWAEVAQETIKSRANGSTFLEISKSNFRQIDVVRPDAEIMKKFDAYVRPWYQRIVTNDYECTNLTTMRDALLPKLISGEIRVLRETGVLENLR